MLYLIIVLACLTVANVVFSFVLFHIYKQQEAQISEHSKKCEMFSQLLDSINETCEKTVSHSNSSASEMYRRIAQCEIVTNQVANGLKILSSGIRSQQSNPHQY